MTRVLLMGPADERTASLEAMIKLRNHGAVVSNDLAHAALLQRMFKPDVVIAPRLLLPAERETLVAAAPTPIVLLIDLQAGGQITLVSAGIARVLPSTPSQGQIDALLTTPLSREKPIARLVAQAALGNVTGTITLSAVDSGSVVADVIVESGTVTATRRGPDLRALLALDTPVRAAFRAVIEEASDEDELTFELDDDDPVTPIADDVRAAASARIAPARVLVVDGDRDLLRFRAELLRRQGYVVEVAVDGDDALAVARGAPPDVFVADATMAGRTGWDLLGLVRSSAGLREIPVVLTCYDGAWLARLHKAGCGADAVVENGLRPERLIAAVERLVAPRRNLAVTVAASSSTAPLQARMRGAGPYTLLSILSDRRFSGRLSLTVGDARFLVVTHDGGLVFARVTSGGVTKMGPAAIGALLQVGAVGFTLSHDAGLGPATTSLFQTVVDAAAAIDANEDDARGSVLAEGRQLAVRGDLLAAFRSTCDVGWRPVVDQIASGRDARDLLARGLDPMLVDSVVRDLFRKGAVSAW
jgi:CheY-like chemotaxis protein